MNKSVIGGLAGMTLALGGPAYAQGHMGGMKADADGNGVVTRAEVQANAATRFAQMDANGDSVLTQADREARMTRRRTEMFSALDADRNGQVSRDEFMAYRSDGRSKGRGKAMTMRGHGGAMLGRMADTDKDGRITRAEFTASALARFDRADSDRNGEISGEERAAMRERMRGAKRDMGAS